MELQSLAADLIFNSDSSYTLLDVRSPGEYRQGHIKGAISFPLFSDEERAEIGTLYKQAGNQDALLKGLEIVGPKLRGFVEEATKRRDGKKIYLYCWRGGMRSRSMATLLQTAGIQCVLIKGGYKAYRNFILDCFKLPWKFKVIGGKTGSGKTQILAALHQLNQQVLDMEAIACHKGSAFGKIGELPQPTTEQFGNEVFEVLRKFDRKKTVWIEDESHTIGSVFIPTELYENYRNSPLLVLDIPLEERLKNLVEVYGSYDLKEIKEAFEKIRKKIGGQNVLAATEMIKNNDAEGAAAIALNYYDKTYLYGLQNKDTSQINYVTFEKLDPIQIAEKLLEMYK